MPKANTTPKDSCQQTQDENLTIKQMRELWKNELLPQLKEELRSELRSEIEAENKCLYSEINAMSESLVNIEVSQTFISEKYDKLLEAIQTTKKQVQSMEKKIKDQGETTSHLQDNVYDNVTSLDAMQQYLRRDCLEITGIPVLPVDKPKELVKELGSALGININENDISTAHRLPDTKKVKDRIIVKFVRRDVREEVYKNRKRLVGKSTTCLPSVNEEIGKSIRNSSKIHINESLTAYRKRLFGKIHAFEKEKIYKFILTANGRIHLRENETATVFHFTTEEEFQDFLNP